MPSYDGVRYDPPAPLAAVTLRDPDQKREVRDVPMLLDTGADVSLVPRVAATELELPQEPAGSYRLLSFDGTPSSAPAVHLELVFCDRVFRGRFLLIEHDCGILGRNVLNRLPILYDGPRLAWGVQRSVEI